MVSYQKSSSLLLGELPRELGSQDIDDRPHQLVLDTLLLSAHLQLHESLFGGQFEHAPGLLHLAQCVPGQHFHVVLCVFLDPQAHPLVELLGGVDLRDYHHTVVEFAHLGLDCSLLAVGVLEVEGQQAGEQVFLVGLHVEAVVCLDVSLVEDPRLHDDREEVGLGLLVPAVDQPQDVADYVVFALQVGLLVLRQYPQHLRPQFVVLHDGLSLLWLLSFLLSCFRLGSEHVETWQVAKHPRGRG